MLNEIGLQFGLEYRIEVRDRESGLLKSSTDWGHNLILNNTGPLFSTGFAESPVPVLGSNGAAVAVTQTGPLTPLPDMRATTTTHDPANTTWVQANPNQAVITWTYDYEYINLTGGTVTLREIGIPNFSRALLKAVDGTNAAVPVTTYDIVSVSLRYILSVNLAKQTMKIVDLGDNEIDSFDVDYELSPPADIKTAKWWKLFAPQSSLTLVTDTGDKVITDYVLETSTTSRGIVYKHTILADDEFVWNGVKYGFASNAPLIHAKWSKAVAVPATQKFEMIINPKW